MTKSQITAGIATTAVIVASVAEKLLPLSKVLPPKLADWLPVIIIVAGAVGALFNQSWAPGHVSIPVETAKAVGVAKSQTAGK